MLKLNLVSDQLKKEIKLRRIYSILKKVGLFFIFIMSVYSLALLFSGLLINTKFQDIVAQTTLISRNTKSYNGRVKSINSELDFISQAQENFIRISCLIKRVKNLSDPYTHISQLQFNRETGSLLIRGKSTNRDELLKFKDLLEKSGYFNSVELPLKNLLTKDDATFEINAQIIINNL